MNIHLNDDEIECLMSLSDVQIRLYIFGIRRYMDYQTGLVGIKRRISYQSLSEALYVEPVRGVKTPSGLSRMQLRRAVKALERAGLISIKSQGLQLILECLLAYQDNSAQIKADTRPTSLTDLNSAQTVTVETLDSIDVAESDQPKANTKPNSPCVKKAATPPKSELITLSKNESVISAQQKRLCRLPADFAVKPAHVDLAIKNHWPDPHQELAAFQDYHVAKGTLMKDWDRAFNTWLRNAKRFRGNSYAKNKQFTPRSESILRVYESCIPSINWREENPSREVCTDTVG